MKTKKQPSEFEMTILLIAAFWITFIAFKFGFEAGRSDAADRALSFDTVFTTVDFILITMTFLCTWTAHLENKKRKLRKEK